MTKKWKQTQRPTAKIHNSYSSLELPSWSFICALIKTLVPKYM